jgi:diaminopimelate decarboxylase
VLGGLTRSARRGKAAIVSEPPRAAAPDLAWVRAQPGRFALGYRGADAAIEQVALAEIAGAVGTPTYVYGAEHVQRAYRGLADALAPIGPMVCFAIKANSSQALLRLLARAGAGADIVSGGELARALAAGFDPARILFSGVGKTEGEIDAAIAAGVRSVNVESAGELALVSQRAVAAGRTVPVTLRVNPDVDPDTHPYLATGLRESKFGIPMGEALALALQASAMPGLRLLGVACHIGSQIADAGPFLASIERLRALVVSLRERGVGLELLDLGGGLGIPYAPGDPEVDVGAWSRAVMEAVGGLGLTVAIEPGRYLVGNAGVLLTRVLGRKIAEGRRFVIVDAAMNDLLRPALYEAYHAIVPVVADAVAPVEVADVVGPVCECGDFLAKDRALHRPEPGDLLAVLGAGAYGMSMASTYNTRPLAAEVLVSGDRFDVVRPRKSVAELIADERVPQWLR